MTRDLTRFQEGIRTGLYLRCVACATLSKLTISASGVYIMISSRVYQVSQRVQGDPILRVSILSPIRALYSNVLVQSKGYDGCGDSAMQASFVSLRSNAFLVGLAGVQRVEGVGLQIRALKVRVRAGHCGVRVANALAVSRRDSLGSIDAYGGARLKIYGTASAVVIQVGEGSRIFAMFRVVARMFRLAYVRVQREVLGHGERISSHFIVYDKLPCVRGHVTRLRYVLQLYSHGTLQTMLGLGVTFYLVDRLFRGYDTVCYSLRSLLF